MSWPEALSVMCIAVCAAAVLVVYFAAPTRRDDN